MKYGSVKSTAAVTMIRDDQGQDGALSNLISWKVLLPMTGAWEQDPTQAILWLEWAHDHKSHGSLQFPFSFQTWILVWKLSALLVHWTRPDRSKQVKLLQNTAKRAAEHLWLLSWEYKGIIPPRPAQSLVGQYKSWTHLHLSPACKTLTEAPHQSMKS